MLFKLFKKMSGINSNTKSNTRNATTFSIQSNAYIDEDKITLILIEQKKDFSDKIKGIYDDLNTKIILDQLGAEQNDKSELLSYEHFQKIKYVGKNRLFIIIILLGFVIFTTHLISVYEINGIINTIEEELIASIISYVKMEKREEKDDFYQNFNTLNGRFPLILFFLYPHFFLNI